jgi:hypothetical protein
MSEDMMKSAGQGLEERSRALFHSSVERLDMATRSRLTQARHAALEAAEGRRARGGGPLRLALAPVAGLAMAAVLAVALWFGTPLGRHGVAEPQVGNLEDLELVAASDAPSSDAIEMLQEDPDFYAWADKAADVEPAA